LHVQKHVASHHLKGSRKLQNFDFTGGFISGFGTSSGTAGNSGSTNIMGLAGVGTSTGTGNFTTASGSSGYISTLFGSAMGSGGSGGSGFQNGNSGVDGDVGVSNFTGTTTVNSEGVFGAGFSPFDGQAFGPTGGFALGTGTFDVDSQSQGTSGGTGVGTSSGSNFGGASNFGGGSATGSIPMVFSAGGIGSGASNGTVTGAGSSSLDPTGASFLGTGTLSNVNFQNFGGAIVGPGGTVNFPFAPVP
jgi:hypothetical protein